MSIQAFGGLETAPIPQPPFAATPVVYYTATPLEVAALATAGTPVPPGAMLIDPTSRLIYGQSDGVGGYEALGTSTGLSVNTVDSLLGQLPRWKAALAAVKAGSRNAQVLVIGDGFSAGNYSLSTSANAQNSASASWVRRLASLLEDAGYPANTDTIFIGDASATSGAQFEKLDMRTNFAGGGTHYREDDGPGGKIIHNISGTAGITGAQAPFVLYPDKPYDTIEWVHRNAAGYSTQGRISVDYGVSSVGATVDLTAGGSVIVKDTRTVAKRRGEVWVQKLNATSARLNALSISAYDSTQKCVRVMNASFAGATPLLQADSAAYYSPLTVLSNTALYQPDLVIICLDIENWIANYAHGTYDLATTTTHSYQIQQIINAFSGSADVVLMTAPPSANAVASIANQRLQANATRQLAALNGLQVIDCYALFGSQVAAAANGYHDTSSTTYPGTLGHGKVAQLAAQVLGLDADPIETTQDYIVPMPADSVTVPANFMGMCVMRWPDQNIQSSDNPAGVIDWGFARMSQNYEAHWTRLETSAGVYDAAMLARLDAQITFQRQNGASVMMSAYATPRFYADNTVANPSATDYNATGPYGYQGEGAFPTSLAALANHVTMLINRYNKPGGAWYDVYGSTLGKGIQFWETGNEPAPGGGNGSTKFFWGSQAQLSDYCATQYDAVKATDSSVIVISPGFVGSVDSQVAAFFGTAGGATGKTGAQTCDALGLHAYGINPVGHTVYSSTNSSDIANNATNGLIVVRRAMREFNAGVELPIYLTEWGAFLDPAGAGAVAFNAASADVRYKWLCRWFMQLAAFGVRAQMPWHWEFEFPSQTHGGDWQNDTEGSVRAYNDAAARLPGRTIVQCRVAPYGATTVVFSDGTQWAV